MDSQAGVLPEALAKRQRVVELENIGKTIVVEKWSISKTLAIVGFFEEAVQGIPAEELAMMAGGSLGSVAKAAKILGPRITQFLQLSVKESDRSLITGDLPAEDGLDLLEAVLDLNLTEKLVKKAKALFERMKRATAAGPVESGALGGKASDPKKK